MKISAVVMVVGPDSRKRTWYATREADADIVFKWLRVHLMALSQHHGVSEVDVNIRVVEEDDE